MNQHPLKLILRVMLVMIGLVILGFLEIFILDRLNFPFNDSDLLPVILIALNLLLVFMLRKRLFKL